MDLKRDNDGSTDARAAGGQDTVPLYEPPKIVALGNVRDLLAGAVSNGVVQDTVVDDGTSVGFKS